MISMSAFKIVIVESRVSERVEMIVDHMAVMKIILVFTVNDFESHRNIITNLH